MEKNNIKIYARVDENGFVSAFLDTAHSIDDIKEGDVFIEEGIGDDFAYPHTRYENPLIPFDKNGCHNFKVENNVLIKTTDEEKQSQLLKKSPSQTNYKERIEILENTIMELLMA